MRHGTAGRDGSGGDVVLDPGEAIDRPHAAALWSLVNRALDERRPARLVLDLRKVSKVDGAGVALLRELAARCRRRGVAFSAEGAVPPVSSFLAFVEGRSPERPKAPSARRPAAVLALSERVARLGRDLRASAEFVGRFAESLGRLALRPDRLRVDEVAYQVQRSGAEGTPLLVALSLLLGVIMAFQGLQGIGGFGSPILVADVVTLSTTREMAPLLTGVIVAGRSGAAFAAEIGTMKVDQELDALSVMGFDVMRFLFVPRILGLVIATPLLTLLSMAAGILGGAGVAVFDLDLPFVAYIGEVRNAITGAEIVSALAKAVTFGLMIGVVACFQGMQTGDAAEDVGTRTTAAVVRGILLVVAADAFFSIAAEVYHW